MRHECSLEGASGFTPTFIAAEVLLKCSLQEAGLPNAWEIQGKPWVFHAILFHIYSILLT